MPRHRDLLQHQAHLLPQADRHTADRQAQLADTLHQHPEHLQLTGHPILSHTEAADHLTAAAQARQAVQATRLQAQAGAATAAEAAIAEAEAGAEEAATVEAAAETAVHHQAEDNRNLNVKRI